MVFVKKLFAGCKFSDPGCAKNIEILIDNCFLGWFNKKQMGRLLCGLRVLCGKQITLVPDLDNASVGKN